LNENSEKEKIEMESLKFEGVRICAIHD